MVAVARKRGNELPDALMLQAKKRAAELKRPVRDLVEAGLRDQRRKKPKSKKIKWVLSQDRAQLKVDITSREAMLAALDEDGQ